MKIFFENKHGTRLSYKLSMNNCDLINSADNSQF